MLKEQMIKFKDIFNNNNNNNGNNKKKIENLTFFIIILVITLIIINMILKNNNKNNREFNEEGSHKVLAKTDKSITTSNISEEDKLNVKLEDILSKIDGVGDVKVLITYSRTSQTIPLYNEDKSIKDTKEKDSGGGDRKINETSNKKEVIYQEINGEKVPVTQSIINPTIEGAVIIAKGANNSQVRLKITQAVEAATGLPVHKIQVFEMAD